MSHAEASCLSRDRSSFLERHVLLSANLFRTTSHGIASGSTTPAFAERLRTSRLRARVLPNALALDLQCSTALCKFAKAPVLSRYAVSSVFYARGMLFEKGVLRFSILSPQAMNSLRSSAAIVISFFDRP